MPGIKCQKRTTFIQLTVSGSDWASLHSDQVAHQAGTYPGFLSVKQLGVFLPPGPFPLGWDASPSQGYPQE